MYAQIKYTLHLPQYLSFLISLFAASEITSIGCHTMLWDFKKDNYHDWVNKEGIHSKFPSLYPGNKATNIINGNRKISIGIGLHDSSAALIPYLKIFKEPFVLLSTGTWCISLNPFNSSLLSDYQLHNDCLCYLSYNGKPVKASRLFSGYEHEQQIKRLASHFNTSVNYYQTINYNAELIKKIQYKNSNEKLSSSLIIMQQSLFKKRLLSDFESL